MRRHVEIEYSCVRMNAKMIEYIINGLSCRDEATVIWIHCQRE
ncbi:hypothetical protein OIU77_013452 [Salix suchowensis]|uniref:Uncharacterized protein n=1 Tax=Salix suchowensis TaxID=1278906 RepID=A0ABQ8ZU93_9ROSI|nr:hypothetical protein OIU77_013452 [Salix suchowensis]